MPKRPLLNILRVLLGILCCVGLARSATHAHATPAIGELPGLRAALLSQNPPLQSAAVRYISHWDRPIAHPPPELAAQIRALPADETFGAIFLERLSALSNLGESIQSEESQLLKIIQTNQRDNPDRPDAIRLLAQSPHRAQYHPLLTQLLSDRQTPIHVRNAAAAALGQLGPVALPDLLKVLRDRQEDPWVRGSAAQGLSQLGDAAKPYIADIGNLLRDQSLTTIEGQNGQVGAAQALSRLGAKEYLPDIYQFVKDPDTKPITYANAAMAEVFADFGPAAQGYIPQLITLLQQPEPAGMAHWRAIEILGKWGDAAKPALPLLTKLAQDCNGKAALAIARLEPNQSAALQNTLRCATQFQDQRDRKGAQISLVSLHEALGEWAQRRGGLDIPTIVPLLNIKPQNMQDDTQLLWYRLSGGRSDVLALVKQFDDRHRGKLQQISRQDALTALAAMDLAWTASPDLPQVRSALAAQIGLVIFGSPWQTLDIGRLQAAYDRLKPAYPQAASMISVKLTSLHRGVFGLVGGGCLLMGLLLLIGRRFRR
jgi:HEAT repeat protein